MGNARTLPAAVARRVFRADDGLLLDIVVPDADIEAWDRTLALVASWPGATHVVGSQQRPPPRRFTDFRSTSQAEGGCISIWVSGCQVNLHHFGDDEIELDIDPGDVGSDESARGLLGFVADLARAIGREVHIAPESLHAMVLLAFHPVRAEWTW